METVGKKKIRRMCAAAVGMIFVAVVLVSCGSSLTVVKLDEETDRQVSTITIRDDSFTLPFKASLLSEKGYISKNTEDPDSLYKIQIERKNTAGDYTFMDKDGSMFAASFANTSDTSNQLVKCMTYGVRIRSEYCTAGWVYMGLTQDSTPDDVLAAFDGILEFSTTEGDGTFRLTHEDRDRLISFYWDDVEGSGMITELILRLYGGGEYRDYEFSCYFYSNPDSE